ncbi:MAG: vWA domain-containing protein [Ferruginibacter sp.]
MKLHLKLSAFLLLTAFAALLVSFHANDQKINNSLPVRSPAAKPKIQAAILLDVSNSMDGLIEQAKAQLWNMVSVMGKAKCGNDVIPEIEIALYEYGRSSNDVSSGYVKQISAFTQDLDKLSGDLFNLRTNGGDEYCGQVIYTSLNELKWAPGSSNYKVIFIAGNEDFLQGNLHYTKACALAKKNGVIVNTIYCGDRLSGIKEHWNLNAECGTGSFTNIDQNQKIDDIPTPYDNQMFSLNEKLNSTYIAYGNAGKEKMHLQAEMDSKNYALSKSAAADRVSVKGQSNIYKNDSWDLVDATVAAGSDDMINTIDLRSLPESLQNKSRADLKKLVREKTQQRSALQKEIASVNKKRQDFLITEKKKNANAKGQAGLETAMEKIIKEQAVRSNMRID